MDAQKEGIRAPVYAVNGDVYTGEWKDNRKHGELHCIVGGPTQEILSCGELILVDRFNWCGWKTFYQTSKACLDGC